MSASPTTDIPDDPVFSVLRAAARHDYDSSAYRWVSGLDPVTLTTASGSHGVDHLMLPFMKAVAPDHATVPILQKRNNDSARFHLRSLAALRAAGLALTDAGVNHVAFKGPILATLTPSTSSRGYSDLDLMVSPQNLGRAVSVLEGAGASLSPGAGWKRLLKTAHAQVPMVLPLSVPLDLHWHLCSQPHMRRAFTVEPADALIDRSITMDTAAGPARVLGWNDMLVHTASHAGWSGGDRLGWLADVDAVVRSGCVDWDIVVVTTRAWGLSALVGDILRRTCEALDTPIPVEVISALRGGGLGALLRSTERLIPMTSERNTRSARRMLRMDVRSGMASTLGALTRRTGAAAARRARQRSLDPIDVGEPRPADDEDWRQPYFAFALSESSATQRANRS